MDINQKQNSIFDQDLNLSDLWEIIKLRSRILLFSLAIFSLAGIAYSLSLNNIYNSSVKLMPQEELSISSQSINGLSSILGGKKSSRSQRLLIAEELIASQKFIDDLLAKNNLAETVLLAREWDNKNNKLDNKITIALCLYSIRSRLTTINTAIIYKQPLIGLYALYG